ncbi:tetratricopeptide repeat protein [Pseudoalteromonas sp. Cnat2-41]|uniref:tetratricopeptide repeat protein n=1 Tax=unclassified Pseudoalteromonas TaxID=194690 RepID=UPI001EF967A6|nr:MULTISPECIES: tetratricopeptide repeat protein [unclassified Pseudoalteromonas]MCF2861521.1 sel1 repeat family protein [Pseudoalteromonas sp. CNAT2-18]MCG7557441.1 sel1 repeat family protein [Pseudoalteromonas sp. CNAT2-18.1]
MKKRTFIVLLGIISSTASYAQQVKTDNSLLATASSAEQRNIDVQLQKARMGDATAMARTGRLFAFERQRSSKANFEQAHYWLNKAIEHGNTDAFYYYAKLYEKGVFGSKDPEKAFDYYQQGADNGNLTAMYHVYEAYRDGKGFAMDEEKAEEVLNECAKAGGELCTILKETRANLKRSRKQSN